MLISPAFAQTAAPAGFAGGLIQFLPLILIFAVFYFLLIRPQQRKVKEHRDMIAALKKGDKVVTGGGIIGTVVKAEDADDVLIVEIAQNIRVRVARGTITGRVGEPRPAPTAVPAAANDGAAKPEGLKALRSKLFGK